MIQFVCFSKDRPLQLHAYLKSFYRYVTDYDNVSMSVLCYSTPAYTEAYQDIQRSFPQSTFVYETNFIQDLSQLLTPAEFTCFGCDDVIFIRDINATDIQNFISSTDTIGLSFRLGQSIHRGMFEQPMPQPAFTPAGQNFITWPLHGSQGDWAYPWDVLGTVVRTTLLESLWPALWNAHNPSEFEAIGAQCWPSVRLHTLYAAYQSPRIVCLAINVVQNVFPNGIVGPSQMDPLFLQECWNNGLRIDLDQYTEFDSDTWRIGDLFLRRS